MQGADPPTRIPPETGHETPQPVQSLRVLFFILFVLVVLALQLFFFVREYAVNLLHFDQWSFLTPLFKNASMWENFRWQHGPHRQGLGNVVVSWVLTATHWDTVVEGLFISALLVAATFTALFLKKRLFGRLTAYDAVIPILCISLDQFDTIVAIPNMSHSILPLLLVFLFCLANTIPWRIPQALGMIVLSFLLVFTGFGILAGVMILVLFLFRAYHSIRQQNVLNLVGSAAAVLLIGCSFVVFFVGYRFNAGVPNFVFPHPRPWEYLNVFFSVFGSFWGFRKGALSLAVGGICAAIVICVWGRSVRESLRSSMPREQYNTTVFVLAGFSILFCAGVSIGRISLGERAGTAYRYVTLLIPAFVSLYFGILTLGNRKLRSILLATFVGLVVVKSAYFSFPLSQRTLKTVVTMRARKLAWISCYERSENLERARRISTLKIHPSPHNANLEEKLRYLKKNRLNLFKKDEK